MKFDKSVQHSFSLIGQFGINMLVPIAACSIVGILLDRKLGTEFIFFIMFFLGAVTGGYNVYRMAKRHLRKNNPDSPYLHGARADDTKESKPDVENSRAD